ncbi:MAG: hypothetical protein WCK49_09990 [Myxococcaceae bacterium]
MRNKTIQARISETTDKEITFLKETLGVNQITEIITLSIHALAQEYRQEKSRQTPFEAIEELGLIGSIEQADPSLSENYKSILSKNFKAKHATH